MEKNNCSFTNFPSSSSGQLSESNAAYFSWPASSKLNDAAEDRANYFGNLQKGVLPETLGRLPSGQRATTILELMTIRAFHSKNLRRYSLGTAIGFRIRRGVLTDIPAILVFVARKVHYEWLSHIQLLPTALEGPGGIWCDVDVLEFSYFGASVPTPKEQLYNELVDGLRGSDPYIGPGSQVATQETYGTLGAIVKSRTGNRQVGFLTNRHVAVDLDYPNQKMFHPLPPNHGPSVYLGAVERATSFITDDLWYGIFAGINPETFVRADGAFIPFSEDFDIGSVTTAVRGVGEIGDVHTIDLQSPIDSLVGRQVIKVGRSSGLTTGTIMAYGLEYNDEKGICFLTDFLVVGENHDLFDMGGDSGSLVLLTGDHGEKPKPVGIIWGGTGNRGRLKLKVGQPPVNWTSGVDLGRLLDLLDLDLIATTEALQAAVLEQMKVSGAASASAIEKSCPTYLMQSKDKTENLNLPALRIQQITKDGNESAPYMEHHFIPSCKEKASGADCASAIEKSCPTYLMRLKDQTENLNFPALRIQQITKDGNESALNMEHHFIPSCKEKASGAECASAIEKSCPTYLMQSKDKTENLSLPALRVQQITKDGNEQITKDGNEQITKDGNESAPNMEHHFIQSCKDKASGADCASAIEKSCPTYLMQSKDKTENLNFPALRIQQITNDGNESAPNMEHYFIPTCKEKSPTCQNDQKADLGYRDPDEESLVSLRLGEPQPKRRKRSESETGI